MEVQPGNDGRARVALGPVERWAAGVMGAAIVMCGYWLLGSVQSMLGQQQATAQQLATMTQQLQTINTQLADVPALKLEVAKTQIKVEQHDQEIKELKQLRGMK
ncbi:hypothetical protein ACP93_02580 [Xanthomonas sp. NCPPB 1128]|uniref:hypothetical protein n=1 Tax=Xanthomonas sp. NCPPB 1128 TaxID=1775876 RepID=UPI00065AA8CB|nr:hypothetical protein [Xanthomonas sp. NCPPB 1128]KMM77068.1 hypothetical protein ACP93_02315 [Xanthomonas sp. NCPPB 1128]KMM77112.1 hypothetical protein ACP93_02580 [Xanthomonas sp. NCPPB 1128]